MKTAREMKEYTDQSINITNKDLIEEYTKTFYQGILKAAEAGHYAYIYKCQKEERAGHFNSIFSEVRDIFRRAGYQVIFGKNTSYATLDYIKVTWYCA